MTKQYCYIHSPNIVFQAQVNQASFTYPIAEVTYDSVASGAYTDVRAGYTVIFGTTAGASDLGKQRIRKAPTSNTLYFGRSSKNTHTGEVNLQDDAYITVLEIDEVWYKVPRLDTTTDPVTEYKDHDIAVGTKTTDPPPKASIIGYGRCAVADSGTNTVQLTFNANDYTYADGASISSGSWDAGHGTIDVSLISSMTATFGPGFSYVSHTTQDSNGETHTVYIPVFIKDPSSTTDTVAFQIVGHEYSMGEPGTMAIRVLEDVDASSYPDGTLVMIWEGEPASADDRSHMLFVGWLATDDEGVTAGLTGSLKDTVLNLVDPAGALARLPAFSQSLEYNASPATWQQTTHANMFHFFDYMLRWHTNALDMFNLDMNSDLVNFKYVILETNGSSMWELAGQRARNLVPEFKMTCSRNGDIFVRPDPMTYDSAINVSQATVDGSDLMRVRKFGHHWPRYHWRWGEAILSSDGAIAPIFSVAPGDAPGQGRDESPAIGRIARSQDALNSTIGKIYARVNALKEPWELELHHDDDRIDPAEMKWITVTIPTVFRTRRREQLTSDYLLPLRVSIAYDYSRTAATKTVTVIGEEQITGTVDGQTYTPPEPVDPSDWEPPPLPPPEEDPSTAPGNGLGTVYVMTPNSLYRTRNFSEASPTYTEIGPTHTDFYRYFILDPWAPATTAYIVGDDGVWKSTDMDQAAPSWTMVLSYAAINTGIGTTWSGGPAVLRGSINVENYIGLMLEEAPSTYYIYTTDGGSNWNFSTVESTSKYRWGYNFYIAPYLTGSSTVRVGVNLTYISNTSGNYDRQFYYQSDDGGATWTQKATVTPYTSNTAISSRSAGIIFPYNGGSGDVDTIYVLSGHSSGGIVLWKSTDGGSNWTAQNAGIPASSTSWEAIKNYDCLHIYTQDNNYMNILSHDPTANDLTVEKTTDGGVIWTRVENDSGHVTMGAGGFPYNPDRLYRVKQRDATSGSPSIHVQISDDQGATWTDKTGNISENSPWTHGIEHGNGVIVPVWVAE